MTSANPKRKRVEAVGATRMMINYNFYLGIIEGIHRDEMGINRISNRQYKDMIATN